jgi:hypothetical protein
MTSAKAPRDWPPRIDAADLKRRLDAGQRGVLLDVRAPHAWDSSNEKVPGADRTMPDHLQVDPPWQRSQLIVAYCT